MHKLLPVLLNRTSGGSDAREIPDRIRKAFNSAGAEADVRIAADGEQFVALAKAAAAGDSAAIVAAGGDGSIGSIASVLAGTDKPLGVLPLGTLNHFSKDLGIPPDLDEAARTVVRGRVARIDVGEVNGRIFVNNSGIGLYPRIVHRREQQREKLGWGKWPAFVWATLHALHRHRSLDVVLASDGREIRRETPFVFIGNNFYEMEGFDVGTRERLDRGELSAYLAPGARPADFVILALRALLGRLRGSPGFEVLRTTELRIETRGDRVRVANDGEIAMLSTPLRYRILPGALRVIVPSEPIHEAP
jgi:diacylglycerol kinase family enzyme